MRNTSSFITVQTPRSAAVGEKEAAACRARGQRGTARLEETKTKKRNRWWSLDSSGCLIEIFGDLLHSYYSRIISTRTKVHMVECILRNVAATPYSNPPRFETAAITAGGLVI